MRWENARSILGPLVLLMAAVALIAACGGSAGNVESNGQQSSSSDAGGVTADSQPSTGGASAQGGGSSSSGVSNLTTPCNAFSMLGSAGLAGAFTAGGANFDTSGSPKSEFAKNMASFAEDALETVLDGDVSGDCFFEGTVGDEGAVWIAMSLPSNPPAGSAQAMGDAMTQMGATVTGAISAGAQTGGFDMVAFEGLPFETPSGASVEGAVMFMTTPEGQTLAMVMAGYKNRAESQPSPVDGVRPETSVADIPVAVVPSGDAAAVNDVLQPQLEAALGVGLVVEIASQISAGANSIVSLSYAPDGEISADSLASFTQVVESLGGAVTLSMTAGGGSIVTFEGMAINDLTASGSLTLADDKILATFTTEGQ